MKANRLRETSRAAAIGLILVGMIFAGLVSVPGQVKGSTNEFQCETIDGYIGRQGTGWSSMYWNSYDTRLTVGQFPLMGDTVTYRGYISFDTSTVPADATMTGASLRLCLLENNADNPFTVQIFGSNFTTLDKDDWNSTGSFQGSMPQFTISSPVDTWYSVNVNPDYINRTGQTQYALQSNREGTPPTTTEYVHFYSGNSYHPGVLELTYSIRGTYVRIQLSTGTWFNQTAYPDIQEWNLTYDLYCFEFDSVPNAVNITIDKQETTWTFRGAAPGCNYTESDTELILKDVFDSITYRVWFTVPRSSPYSMVHLSLYNSFTGEGYSWEQMAVQMCTGASWDNTTAETIAKPDFPVESNATYTLRILDFFGNVLTEYIFVANAENVYLEVAVPYYSWQIFNMNDAPVLMRIYWNNSGSPWEFFVGPHWIIERFLKGGDYSFMVTFYNTDGTAGETVYYNRTVPMPALNASFVYVSGTTLSEIVSSVQGIMASQEIITSLVSPSVVLVYENLPIAPAKVRSLSMLGSVSLDPYLVLETTTFQNGTGTDITMGCPYPGDIARSYTIFTDILTFSGPYDAQVLVNTSAGDSLYSSATLPASVVLSGADNITVWSNLTITVFRATAWREVGEYTVTHYATERRYVATLSFNNSMTLDYYQPYWYVAFPANTTVDQNSVSVYDLDNDCPLSIRINFEVTAGGIHLTLPYLNSSGARNFRFTYWDLNGTTPTGAPNLVTDSYTTKTLNDHIMKYTSVQWVNPWPQVYAGEIYITLNYSGGDNLLRSSITVIDETTGNALRSSDWLYTGRTLIILTSGVGSVGIGQGRNFGIYFAFNAEITPTEQHDFFFSPIVWNEQSFYIGGVGVSVFLIGIVVMWLLVGYAFWRGKEDWPIFVIPLCVTIIGFYFQGVMT